MLNNIQSIGAEVQVLGLIINQLDTGENAAFYLVDNVLSAEDFYDERNKIIYKTIAEGINKHGIKSSLEVVEVLEANPEYKGTFEYFGKLLTSPCGIYQVETLAAKIAEKALLRRVYTLSQELQLDCLRPDADAFQVLATAEGNLTKANAQLKDEETSVSDALGMVFDKAFKAKKGDYSQLIRWPKELDKLNQITGGMTKGDFIVLAARPGMGKTALAIQTAVSCVKAGQRVCFVSVEMTKEKILQRIVKPDGVSDTMVNEGSLTQEQIEQMSFKVSKAQEVFPGKFDIFDRNVGQVDQLISKVKGNHARNPYDLLIVDYLQLISGPRGADAYQRVTDVSMALTHLTKSLNVPCICLAQLSRAVEQRADKRPQLSDLRDSGQIEQDAAQVVFIAPNPANVEDRSNLIITVEKNRNGKLGIVPVDYAGVNYKFTEIKDF